MFAGTVLLRGLQRDFVSSGRFIDSRKNISIA